MELKSTTPNLRSSVALARSFYKRLDAMPLYDHCHRVFTRASQEIFDKEAEPRPEDEEKRTLFNSTIADIALYHVVDSNKLAEHAPGLSFLPAHHPLLGNSLQRELAVFSALTRLDREQGATEKYPEIINHGPAPLALLARLADYAVTHKTEDRTPGHISHHQNPLFRMYSSLTDARRCLENEALAGEGIYAPVAERFGFPNLAGDILKHAYRINHNEVFSHVSALMDAERAKGHLRATQTVARRLCRAVRKTFTEAGFEVEVIPRLEKHEGKVMRKFFRLIMDSYRALDKDIRPEAPEFVSLELPGYTLSSINDPVAIKVILDRFNGKSIDDMPEAEKSEVLRIALFIVTVQLRLLRVNEGYSYKYTRVQKENGYRAHHFDARPITDGRLLPMEVQVKTREWDNIASHGKAAHYYYIGGDPHFIEMIGKAYHDIIYRRGNGENAR